MLILAAYGREHEQACRRISAQCSVLSAVFELISAMQKKNRGIRVLNAGLDSQSAFVTQRVRFAGHSFKYFFVDARDSRIAGSRGISRE